MEGSLMIRRKLFVPICVALIGLLLFGGTAYAIGNPDYVSIGDAYVFKDVWESGDQLYFARYDASYGLVPEEDAEDTWQMALYDSDDNLIATRPLNYYQHNVISIYLTSEEALSWEGAHYIRIMGMPSVFDPLVEGTNMATRVLAPSDYYEVTSLGGIMITQAGILEDDWEIILLTSGSLLNTTGANFFIKAVPGLNSMVPSIFSATTRGIPWTRTALNTTGINMTEGNLPGTLDRALAGLSAMFGVTNRNMGDFSWFLLMGLVVGGVVFGTTRRPDISILGGLMGTIAISAYMGVASPYMMYSLMAVALFIVVLFVLVYIVPRVG